MSVLVEDSSVGVVDDLAGVGIGNMEQAQAGRLWRRPDSVTNRRGAASALGV